MKNTLGIVQEVLQWLEKYAEESPEDSADMNSFIIWLNSKLFSEDHTGQTGRNDDDLNMELSFLLTLQNRYYRTYAKNALNDSDLSSPEGFSFLYHLDHADSYRKMELIKMHHLEPPSGIEVLKRLLKRGFIEEFDDPDDGRAKRIRITDPGREKIASILPGMKEVFSEMTAGMSLNEKVHVIAFLNQMNDYHTHKLSQRKGHQIT